MRVVDRRGEDSGARSTYENFLIEISADDPSFSLDPCALPIPNKLNLKRTPSQDMRQNLIQAKEFFKHLPLCSDIFQFIIFYKLSCRRLLREVRLNSLLCVRKSRILEADQNILRSFRRVISYRRLVY